MDPANCKLSPVSSQARDLLAPLCSAAQTSDVSDGVGVKRRLTPQRRSSVYSNSEKQIGNRVSPNRHLIFSEMNHCNGMCS